jgi:iron complex transport system substrate-binding protein
MCLGVVAGCSLPPPPLGIAPLAENRPKRIVSLDFCADQYVLKLADRGDILALSKDATSDFSYMRKEARGIKTVRSTAEDVLALDPDLIVRSYGGGPNAKAFFEQAGVKVHQVASSQDFDDLRKAARDAALAFGQIDKGEALVADFDRRLAAIKPASNVTALYMTPSGITTGPGSMVDLMMTRAGLINFETQKGWNQLPLETLALKKPDMAITAFFQDQTIGRDNWSSARHPVAMNIMRQLPVAALDGSTTSCGGWFVMDAIEALAQKGRAVQAQKQQPSGGGL